MFVFFEILFFSENKFDTHIHLIQVCKAGFMKLRIYYIVTYKLKHSHYLIYKLKLNVTHRPTCFLKS